MTEVFSRIMLHHPDDAFEKFEQISELVKRNNFKVGTTKDAATVNE